MQRFSPSSKVVLVSVVALAVGAAVVALRPKAPQGAPVAVIAGLDTSDSQRLADANGGTALGHSIALTARLAARLDRNRDRLTVFRVDRQTREFYNGLAPRSREKFQYSLIEQTRERAAVSGTFPHLFWTGAAARAAQAQGPVAVCLFTNGDCDDLSPAAHEQMRRAAASLAANPRVIAVWVFGAESKNWAALNADFAPLGDRLKVQNPGDIDVGPLLAGLEAARHQRDNTQPDKGNGAR